ncbi:MAG TPA: hypothetical protein DDX59_00490 [Lachnospiraceae bacterium]|nr:hypothetical protein [Lachnospiraceae bacterium]
MQPAMVFLFVLIFLIAAAYIAGSANRKREDDALLKKLADSFGKRPDKKIPGERSRHLDGYYKAHPEPVPGGIDDITWNDLELSLVLQRIDTTRSSAGEEYLYYALRTAKRLSAREREVLDYLTGSASSSERSKLQFLLSKLGDTGHYSLYDYLEKLKDAPRRGPLRDLPAILFPFAGVAFMFVNVPAGVLCLLLSFLFGTVTYFRDKAEILPYITCLQYILRLSSCGERLSAAGKTSECLQLQAMAAEIGQAAAPLASLRRGSFLLMSPAGAAGPADFVLDYLRILFHLDLIKFSSLMRGILGHEGDIDRLITLTGRLDMLISTASFRKSLPYWCHPDFSGEDGAGSVFLDVRELYHPLLSKAVPNDLQTDRNILLTGSNASGKSTFLKAAAICALLGQALDTCPAASYRASEYTIMTSMALRDSIQNGQSYFIAEIQSLKRIQDAAKESDGRPVLCCIDEVLRGTNTIERIAASTKILESFSGLPVLCFAATHDIELTSLLQGYDNYHFEEELERGDVMFSYKLRRGPADTRNAIRLLRAAGFPNAVTDGAAEMAGHFEKTGHWLNMQTGDEKQCRMS